MALVANPSSVPVSGKPVVEYVPGKGDAPAKRGNSTQGSNAVPFRKDSAAEKHMAKRRSVQKARKYLSRRRQSA